MNTSRFQINGFTLIEVAIVLVIVGLLISAFLLPLQAQRELAFQAETQTTLENARKALIGFAQANGRLPCPATNGGTALFPDDTGVSNPLAGGICVWQSGFLPGSTLGIQPTDAQGYVIDAWNNRIYYTVTQANISAFTTANQINTLGMTALVPDLRVCATSTPVGCTAFVNLINNSVAVIFSTGATGPLDSLGKPDETQNLNKVVNIDTIFVSHGSTAAGAPNGEFDHLVTWISPFMLYNAMIQAGQLH